jgi:hypothetical protein
LFKSPIRGFQSVKSFDLDPEALKVFPKPHHKMVAFAGSETIQMDRDTVAVPVTKIGAYLRNLLKDKL